LVIVSIVAGIAAYARYTYTMSVSSTLQIINQTAYCDSALTGMTGVDKIIGVQNLQKKGFLGIWSTVSGGTWTKTVYSRNIEMNNTLSGLSNGTYQLVSEFEVYCGNDFETVEKISREVTI
jgi:hypothetical protein